jgi:hypothetical protein
VQNNIQPTQAVYNKAILPVSVGMLKDLEDELQTMTSAIHDDDVCMLCKLNTIIASIGEIKDLFELPLHE